MVTTKAEAERVILDAGLKIDHGLTWYDDEIGFGQVTSIGGQMKVRFESRDDDGE